MIKKIIPLAALFFSGYATAQVGVGVKKPAEASMLDVSAKDKGVLLPRVTLLSETDTSTIKGQHIESLLVYNLGTANLKAGFYYWFESKWIPLMSGSTITDTTNKSFTISEDKEKLVITDSQNNIVALAVKDIANNSVFITELAGNKEFVSNLINNNDFITELVENKEFIKQLGDNIDFVENITNNNEFIENIINKLEGEYGNVSYDSVTKEFYYYDNGVKTPVDWSTLNTTNLSFTMEGDFLSVNDSAGDSVQLSVIDLASSKTFVEHIASNKDFITKLGDNIDFVENITNNNEFIENIINKLEGEYGNVSYDTDKNQFFYIKDGKVEYIDWSNLDTVNVSFAIDANKENLVITDSRGESVSLSVDALGETIAKNDVFVTNLTENSEFVTKLVENKEFIKQLGDNIDFVENITNNNEFIEHIINKLEGEYGNVSYDTDKNQFFYIKDGKVEYIDWSNLDTVNVSFAIDTNKENLVITDSRGESVSLSVDALGETIANNDVFVTNLTENSEFVTKLVENKEFIKQLGDNIDFVENITNNNEFIEHIINKLEGEYGNVSYDTDKNQFFYIKDGKVEYIDWSNLDTVNVSFAIDANKENLVITDSRGESVSLSVDALGETIAKNDVFVTNLTENSKFVTKLVENKEFIKKLGDNIEFVENITNNNEFIENIINKLEGEYGNVSYDTEKNQFFYIKDGKVEYIDWSNLDTVNVSFAIDANKENLVITDSRGESVSLSVDALGETIAKNDVFVTNLTENSEFVTKLVENKEFIKQLGDNIDFVENITNNNEFIENIINKLEGEYGNVSYDSVTKEFYYYDNGVKTPVDWSTLNTTNLSFTMEGDFLSVNDSAGDSVQLSVIDLASSKTFVEHIASNKDFITKLGDNIDFVENITNNNEFIENIINKLEGEYGNVSYDTDKNQFFYIKDGKVEYIDWSNLDTVNVSFAIDANKENLVITDSRGESVSLSVDALGETIAKNDVFVTNLTENSEFVTKLVENKEFIKQLGDNIDFVENITNNNEFIENIINKLEGEYGNVSYDSVTKEFYYYDNGVKTPVDWSALNTTNLSFTMEGDFLSVNDSAGDSVQLSVIDLASSKTFVEHIASNKDFITKLGDNIDFVENITNNNEFIENIINKLEGEYGNVGYDATNNKFYYIKDGRIEYIDWSYLDTVNVSFAIDANKENLVITDSRGESVSLSVDALGETIANNDVFVTNLVENSEFVKQITNNAEFIENIINKLEGEYGNVSYDSVTKEFYYYDNGVKTPVDWSALNTTNLSFTMEGDFLSVNDSAGDSVQLSVTDLASNKTFVEHIASNKDFITKLGDNIDFVENITNNNEFIENIINKLEGEYGNVGYDATNNKFYYIKDGRIEYIDWSYLDTVNVSFAIDTNKENLVITDSKGGSVSLSVDALGETIANNDVFVTNLVENSEFVKQITNNAEFIENIINKLEGEYGNVSYDSVTKEFYYYDNGVKTPVDWSTLNTTNLSFTMEGDFLSVNDSAGDSVQLSVIDLASSKTFVEHIASNKDFITKLGDNIDFVENITNNNEFIENIINKLEGEYGNVSYDSVTKEFYYYDNGVKTPVDWSALNTTNLSFTMEGDFLSVNDSAGDSVQLSVIDLASSKTFVEHIASNKDFITKLGDNIDFVENITNNNEFIENIINKLEGEYGNVSYDSVTKEFYYYDNGVKTPVDWSALNTTNLSFTMEGDFLSVNDSAGDSVQLSVIDLASSKTFVEHIASNKDFITKLGDNIDFVENITNNNEFIENIINKLEGEYGNVSYDSVTKEFYYYDNGVKTPVDWSALNTTNLSFTMEGDFLSVNDSAGDSVQLSVIDLASSKTFVEHIASNKDFITKLGDNIDFVENITNNNEFIENIINKLEGEYGNVGYDATNNKFYYIKDGRIEYIDWSYLDTVNVSFAIDANKENLVITDSKGGSVSLSVDALGETIANNDVFVTNLVENSEFVKQITNNAEFIENIINKLEGEYGNVSYDNVTKEFYYYDNGVKTPVDWSTLNTTNLSFTMEGDFLSVNDSAGDSVQLSVIDLASSKNFVEHIASNKDFITKLGDNIDFVENITNNNEFIENIINKLEGEYGNVGYDATNNKFYYIKDGRIEYIDWSYLDTVNVSFAIDANKENLVITDSKGGSVSLSVDALGETIANNDVFVTNLTENKEFITKLGDNNEFIKQIIKNIEKEAIPGTVTVIEKDGDFVFKWKTKDNQDQESSLTDFIKEHSVLASLTLKDSGNTNDVKAGFVFNNGANNAADIVFAETLTEIQKGYSKHQVNQEEIELKEYYFIDETREKDPITIKVSETIIDEFDKIVKFDNVKDILIDFVTSVGGDVSVKKEGEDLVITTKEGTFKVSDVVNAFETNTTIVPEEYMVFVYLDEIDGEDREVHTDVERDDETFTRQYKAIKYVYTNEKGQKKDIKGSELFGQMGGSSGGGFETLTELMFDKDFGAAEGQPGTGKAALVYKDEEKVLTPIYISDMFKESAETLTSLAIDENANSLVYKDERGTSNYVSLNDINQEPWYTGNDEKATKNDQDIYTMGWVGIGYKDKSGAPNEKLRVNGSITATNSYYADYVFESYFDGYSTLKYDYKFNDLNTVDSYIKSNRHLPGITPISDLEKTETGYSFNVSELSIQLLEKTEELFLHVIDQQKELNAKDKEIQDLKNDVNDLAKRLEALEALLK